MNTLSKFYFNTLSYLNYTTPAPTVDLSPVDNFDLRRYLGKWYEIARMDHRFERGLTHVTANYTPRTDGSINVLNSGYRDGRLTSATGKARIDNKFDGSTHKGALKVSFFANLYTPYRVIMIDPQYTYALVASSENYLWILSRTPSLPEATLQKILHQAKNRGFNIERLLFVEQQ